jgi:4a-hydroxytetrahydrobiopterin dehydratase
MVAVTLYTRANCPLCDKAKAAIRASGVDVELTEVDIDQEDALRARYTDDVPVIHVEGKEAFRHSVDPAAFAAFVKALPRSLAGDELRALQDKLGRGWQVIEGHHLEKTFKFPDFVQALAMTNKIGEIAEELGHHPDIYLTWGQVRVTIWTHDVNGLSPADFALAARIDAD